MRCAKLHCPQTSDVNLSGYFGGEYLILGAPSIEIFSSSCGDGLRRR